MGVLNFENEPGLKSKISACSPSVHSRRTGAVLVTKRATLGELFDSKRRSFYLLGLISNISVV